LPAPHQGISIKNELSQIATIPGMSAAFATQYVATIFQITNVLKGKKRVSLLNLSFKYNKGTQATKMSGVRPNGGKESAKNKPERPDQRKHLMYSDWLGLNL